VVQEGEDLLWGDLFDASIAEFMDQPLDDGPAWIKEMSASEPLMRYRNIMDGVKTAGAWRLAG
jgi:hypothetical protein